MTPTTALFARTPRRHLASDLLVAAFVAAISASFLAHAFAPPQPSAQSPQAQVAARESALSTQP